MFGAIHIAVYKVISLHTCMLL